MNVSAIFALALLATGTPLVAEAPVEYVSQSGQASRAVLGFAHGYLYQTYEDLRPTERLQTEFRTRVRLVQQRAAFLLDEIPVFIPTRAQKQMNTTSFSCTATESGKDFLVECVSLKSSRRFESAYSPSSGVLWFEGICYPDVEQTCRYIPLEPGKLFFSPKMMAALR